MATLTICSRWLPQRRGIQVSRSSTTSSTCSARRRCGPGWRRCRPTIRAAVLTEQLTGLRASQLGRWLRPEPAPGRSAGSARISLSGIVRDRAVALFCLDQAASGRSAAMIANLVALDAAAAFAASQRLEVAGDGLAWFSRCEAVDQPVLAALVATGA